MKQFSSDGKLIQLEVVSGQLLFIDPAYFDEVAAAYEELKDSPRTDIKEFILSIEKKVFPYGGGSLLGFRNLANSKKYELNIDLVTSYDSDQPEGEAIEIKAVEKSITAFGVDSCSFLIIDMANFDALLPLLRADDLFDLIDTPVGSYIEKINNSVGNMGWAYILSPGINSGFDFEGDGSYYIKD